MYSVLFLHFFFTCPIIIPQTSGVSGCQVTLSWFPWWNSLLGSYDMLLILFCLGTTEATANK